MSDIKVDSKLIQNIAKKVDKEGNNNKVIDGNELSIFVDKLEANGVSDAKQVIDSYDVNKLFYENIFAKKGSKSTDSYQNAIIASINDKSALNANTKTRNDAKMIIDGVKDAVDGWFFGLGTDDKKLKQMVNSINKDNVMEVLNTKYDEKSDETMIQAIIGDTSGDTRKNLLKHILESLIQAADAKQIDVSDIVVADEKGNYTVGTGVKDLEFGSDALDSDSFEKIANAIKDRINNSLEMVTDETKAKEDPKAAMTLLARQADAAGDQNGYLNGDEIGKFKAACNQIGISVNGIIEEINNKEENDAELSAQEKLVQSLFDSNSSLIESSNNQRVLEQTRAMISKAIAEGDDETLNKYFNSEVLTKDNVTEVIKDFDDLGTKLYDEFDDDDAREYLKVIVTALYAKAEDENIDVSDIIRPSGEEFVTPDGEDALDSEYVNEVIKSLRSIIEEEIGE